MVCEGLGHVVRLWVLGCWLGVCYVGSWTTACDMGVRLACIMLVVLRVMSCVVVYGRMDGCLCVSVDGWAESLAYTRMRAPGRVDGCAQTERFTSEESETRNWLEISEINRGEGVVCGADSIYIFWPQNLDLVFRSFR